MAMITLSETVHRF